MHIITIPALAMITLASAGDALAGAVPRADTACTRLSFGKWCYQDAECCRNKCEYFHCA